MADNIRKNGNTDIGDLSSAAEAAEEHNGAPVSAEDCRGDEAAETVPKHELDSLAAELDEYKDRYLRLAAEFDNYRKRMTRDRESAFKDAVAHTVNEFLSVYDNLILALDNPTTDDAYKKGIEMIFGGFCDKLARLGISEIDPKGEKFDPNFHDAVMHVEDETVGESIVVEVLKKGFKTEDKVIRHAIVKVAN